MKQYSDLFSRNLLSNFLELTDNTTICLWIYDSATSTVIISGVFRGELGHAPLGKKISTMGKIEKHGLALFV